ncbi:MAG: sigma-70 family RNA polymerase sigma factor [Phycisphaerales bacterium]
MNAYLAGNRSAFVELLERYRTEVHQFLTRFLGSSAAADDVFQETFLQVHLAAHSFDQTRQFKPWLFTIAANKARDWHRRQKRRSALSLDVPVGSDADGTRMVDLLQADTEAPAAPIERTEVQTQVKAVVDALPAHYREILLLSYFQRMSYAQIAEVLSIPLGTVKSRLHAAVASFSERWKAASGAAAADDTDPDNSTTPRPTVFREPTE